MKRFYPLIYCVMVAMIASLMVSCAAPEAEVDEKEVISVDVTEKEVTVTPEAAVQTEEEITLTVLDVFGGGEDIDKYHLDFIARFEQKHPGVTVEYSTVDVDTIDAKLMTLFSAGDEPDIFWSHPGELYKYISQGKIAPVENLIDQSLFLPGPLSSFKYGDNLYGGTKAMNLVGLWISASFFEDLGLQPPNTWEDLFTDGNEILAAGKIPFAVGNSERWPLGIAYDLLTYNYCGCQNTTTAIYDSDTLSWNDPCFVKAAERLVELVDAGFFPPGLNGLSPNEAVDMLFNDEGGMTFSGNWLIGMAKDAAPSDFQTKIIPWPNPPDAPYPSSGGEAFIGSIAGWVITEKCTHKEMAAEFLNEWARDNANYVEVAGALPVAVGIEPDDPDIRAVAETTSGSICTFTIVNDFAPAVVFEPWLDNIQSLVAGNMTPEQFTQALADIVEKEKSNFP